MPLGILMKDLNEDSSSIRKLLYSVFTKSLNDSNRFRNSFALRLKNYEAAKAVSDTKSRKYFVLEEVMGRNRSSFSALDILTMDLGIRILGASQTGLG